MSKERLEEIRKRLVLLHSAVDVDDETKNYIFKDLKVEWLVEQVQEFEGWLNASTYNQRMLRKENRRYREAIEEALTEGEYEDVHDQLERIVNTLVEALEESS